MSNEAAERLRIGLHNASPTNFDYIRSVARYDLDDALAAERKAGAATERERIRAAVIKAAPHEGCDGSHQFCDPEAMPTGTEVFAILDAEVGR